MSAQLIITLCVILFIIIGFFSGKFDLGLVAMTASAILCLTGVLTFEETFAYFSNSTVVIVFCMLVLGASLQKTHFTVNLQKKLLKFAGHGQGIKLVALYLIACCIMVQVLMPTPLVTMMIPFMASLVGSEEVTPSRLLLPGAVIAHCAQCAVPLGTGLTIAAQVNGFLQSAGASLELGIMDVAKVAVFPLIIVLLYMIFVGWRTIPKYDIDTSKGKAMVIDESNFVSPEKEKLIYIVFIVTMILMLIGKKLPFSMYIVGVFAILILRYTNCISTLDIKNAMNFNVLFLLGGILPVATAMQKSGAGEWITGIVNTMLGSHPSGILILVVFTFAVAILTQLMSNTATWYVFSPLAATVAMNNGYAPAAFIIATSLASFGAMLAPTASPSIAVAYGAGHYTMKDMLRTMLPVWLIYNISVIIFSLIFFPIQ